MTTEHLQRALDHAQRENAALWARLNMGEQIKPDSGVSARLTRTEADLDYLRTEVGLVMERLRDARLYEHSDLLRKAMAETK